MVKQKENTVNSNKNEDTTEEKNMLKEYEFLRSEIMYEMNLHNTLVTFTITVTVAALGAIFGFTSKSPLPFLYLFPFGILLPMSARIEYYRRSMMKLSGYMIVFLEPYLDGINWETRHFAVLNPDFLKENKKGFTITMDKKLKNISNVDIVVNGKKKKWNDCVKYYECFILSLLCYCLYVYSYIAVKLTDTDKLILNILDYLWIILPIVMLIYIYWNTYKTNRVDSYRYIWIDKWKNIQKLENDYKRK